MTCGSLAGLGGLAALWAFNNEDVASAASAAFDPLLLLNLLSFLPDPKFKELDYTGKTVIDCWRFLPELANDPTIRYIPLGIGPCLEG